jgi:hypothetical protein
VTRASWVRLRTLLVVCALCLLRAAPAHAEPPVVVLDASEPLDPALSATLAELLSRIGVRLVRSADGRDVVARVRIEASDAGALVRVDDERGRGLSVRREVTRTGSEALFRETLAHVVLSAVEPLTDAPAAAAEPEPEPEVTASEPIARADALDRPAEPSATHLLLGARGGPLWLAPGHVEVGFMAGLGVELPGRLRPALLLEGGATWPAQLRERDIEAQLRVGSLRLAPRLTVFHGSRMGIDLGIAGGTDIAALVPGRNPPRTRSIRSRRVQPVAGASARLAIALAPSVRMFAGAGLDVDFAPRRWIIGGPRGETTLAELARYRPWAQLGLEWISP